MFASRPIPRSQGWIAAISSRTLYRATWPVIPGSSDVVTDWESLVRDLDVEVPAELIAKHSRMVEKRAAYRRLAVNTDAKPSRNRRK